MSKNCRRIAQITTMSSSSSRRQSTHEPIEIIEDEPEKIEKHRWPSDRVFDEVIHKLSKHLHGEIQKHCATMVKVPLLHPAYHNELRKRTKRYVKRYEIHNGFSSNLRMDMVKLAPRTLDQLKYHESRGLRKANTKIYGESIVTFFNNYLTRHPEICLHGRHPSSACEQDEDIELESLYLSRKKAPRPVDKENNQPNQQHGGGSGPKKSMLSVRRKRHLHRLQAVTQSTGSKDPSRNVKKSCPRKMKMKHPVEPNQELTRSRARRKKAIRCTKERWALANGQFVNPETWPPDRFSNVRRIVSSSPSKLSLCIYGEV